MLIQILQLFIDEHSSLFVVYASYMDFLNYIKMVVNIKLTLYVLRLSQGPACFAKIVFLN